MENEKKLRVIEAAKRVFLRYGFRRVTMQDVAEEAGISRPALYLIFLNKEEVFKATIQEVTAQSMEIIRRELPTLSTIEQKLNSMFEIWTVQPFEIMLKSPDAKDLVHCGHDFAADVLAQISAGFESLLTEVLQPVVAADRQAILPTSEIAHLLAASIHGYKDSARSADELRTLIRNLITLTLAALGVRPTSQSVSADTIA